ncbi:MAG: hypothetical protein ACO1SX_23160 [Actinomycetota bacterium]
MGSGGRRPGAGRKPKAERFARPIAAAEKRIADRLPRLVDAIFDLAEGVQVEDVDADGETRTYRRPPDFKAASYLLDRIMGKPTAEAEAVGDQGGGGDLPITEVTVERMVKPDGDQPLAS